MIRFTRLTLCSGQTGTFMMIVLQLGLAMMPLCLWICSGLTSGTTSGMPSFMRKALVLSTTTAPAATAAGANSLLIAPPAEKKAICTPLKLSLVSSSTVYVLPANSIFLPALLALASSLRLLDGELALGQDGEKFLAHRAGGADDRDIHGHRRLLKTNRPQPLA